MIDVSRQESLVPNQSALESANVLVLGCGAIGSVVAPILTRMGVGRHGTITLCDGDIVEESNLNRQFFGADHIGKNKALAVFAQLKSLNPDVNIEVIPSYLQVDDFNVEDYDAILFCADSLYLEGQVYQRIMDAAKKPIFISPRMSGWIAELFVFVDGMTDVRKLNGVIYFSNKPDKDYAGGATCTAADVEEIKIPSIATVTTTLCGWASQAFLHAIQGWPCHYHRKQDVRMFMGDSVVLEVSA